VRAPDACVATAATEMLRHRERVIGLAQKVRPAPTFPRAVGYDGRTGMEATSVSHLAQEPARRGLAPTIGLLVSMGLMVVIGVVSIVSSLGVIESTRWVEQSYGVMQVLSDAQFTLSDADAARRAYALGGEESHRRAMEQHLARLHDQVADVRARTADQAGQRVNVDTLAAAIGALTTHMREVKPLRAGDDLTTRVERGRRVLAATEAVGGALREMTDRERALLTARAQRDRRRITASQLTTTGSVVAAMVLVGAAFVLVGREAERRNRALAALRAREGALDRTLAAMPDAVVIVDDSGSIVQVNDLAGTLFGYQRDELVGAAIEMLVPDAARAAHVAHREHYLTRPVARPMGGGLKLAARRKDGSEVAVDINLSPLDTAEGHFTITSVRDVTARVAAENELRRSTAAAEAASRELESFSYSVAHDLRSPLRSIDGFSQALIEDCGDQLGAVGHEHLTRVRAAAQRMARLIDDLLSLSRLSRSDLQRGRVDLSALCREVVARLREAEPERAVEVAIEDDLVAQGDPRLLAVALENLLGNAWKFTRQRGDARIAVSATRGDGPTIFHVDDNGAGFDMAYIDKLFGVFQRLHRQDQFEGTGIGLATVQRIVHRHGGRIWAEGRVDGGATFHFVLS
jgi:PAS domain S-box-containing protein